MAQTTGRNLPPPQSPFVDPSTGALSSDGYQYLLSLLAAASSSQATATVSNVLTATGTNQATALQLTSQWNEVDTVASGAGVLLSAYRAGQTQVVFNQGANALLVYPAPGGKINALAVNAAFSVSAGTRATFEFVTASQIRT
jgi:hypothetical protein